MEEVVDDVVDAVDIEPSLHGRRLGGLDDIQSDAVAEVGSSHEDDGADLLARRRVLDDVVHGLDEQRALPRRHGAIVEVEVQVGHQLRRLVALELDPDFLEGRGRSPLPVGCGRVGPQPCNGRGVEDPQIDEAGDRWHFGPQGGVFGRLDAPDVRDPDALPVAGGEADSLVADGDERTGFRGPVALRCVWTAPLLDHAAIHVHLGPEDGAQAAWLRVAAADATRDLLCRVPRDVHVPLRRFEQGSVTGRSSLERDSLAGRECHVLWSSLQVRRDMDK